MTFFRLRATLAAAALACTCAAAPALATALSTGDPTGVPPALVLDAVDSYAAAFNSGTYSLIGSLAFYLDGGSAGETFTLALYDDATGHLPGNLLYSATASYTATGWNGLSNLSGWQVAPGADLWAAIEVGPTDTLGSASITGALLPTGAPSPLSATAFNSGAGYGTSGQPLSFGAQISVVPEPGSAALVALGLVMLLAAARHTVRARPN